jgi:hypothetical protein
VIMNYTRLRGLAVAGSDAAGRRSAHNHAQTARNIRRSLPNAAAGAPANPGGGFRHGPGSRRLLHTRPHLVREAWVEWWPQPARERSDVRPVATLAACCGDVCNG